MSGAKLHAHYVALGYLYEIPEIVIVLAALADIVLDAELVIDADGVTAVREARPPTDC
jgi:hypothetical protein